MILRSVVPHNRNFNKTLPSVIVARHVIVGKHGATASGNDGRRHDALVNSQQEEKDEYQTGNCEERMIHQGLSEGDL